MEYAGKSTITSFFSNSLKTSILCVQLEENTGFYNVSSQVHVAELSSTKVYTHSMFFKKWQVSLISVKIPWPSLTVSTADSVASVARMRANSFARN